MKLQIQKSVFETVITTMSSYLDKKDISSITSHIFINAQNGILNIKATDNEIGLAYKISTANIIDEGSATANGKKLLDIIKSLKDSEITLETVENFLFIRQKGSKYRLPMQIANDFPPFPTIQNRQKIELNAGLLAKSLKKVSSNIENINSKIELTGALIDIKNDHISIVGTDTRRLSVYNLAINSGGEPFNFIIPKKAISEINKLFFEDIEIFYDENIFLAVSKNFEFYTKLINGRYPDYTKVIPSKFKINVNLNREQIADGIRTISMLCEIVKITIAPNKIIFESVSDDNSEAKTELECENSLTEQITFGIKNRFILDFISSIEDSEFSFGYNGDGVPISLISGDLTTVIMPVNF